MVENRSNPKIIDLLNEVLTAELTAINQYFLHAEMAHHWGYERLYGVMRHHSIDEMKHAEKVMERVLYLKGLPNVQRLGKINIGETVPEMFVSDHALEMAAVERLNDSIEICREQNDNGTRLLLEAILASEEEHIDWIEAQQDLIQQIGVENYLAQQIKKAD